jgi:hypothetical protein
VARWLSRSPRFQVDANNSSAIAAIDGPTGIAGGN